MHEFDFSFFFDGKEIFHKPLWPEGEPAWSALENLDAYLKESSLGTIEIDLPAGVYLENASDISIGKGTTVEPGAFIRGPCMIGENCTIRHGAYIRGNVITGDHSVIGHDTEIKHSILFPHAKAAHFAYVGDSILGSYVNLGAGVKCANFRLDEKPVTIFWNGSYHKTGLCKMGSIIGDRVQIGCNTVMNPGSLIGPDSYLAPLLNCNGVIPSFSLVRSKGITRRNTSRRNTHESGL